MTTNRNELNKRLCYLATNESLIAIKYGLSVEPSDVIFSIAAAGDQAFSFLETAKKVITADMNPRQIFYVKKQIELLQNKDFMTFRKPHLSESFRRIPGLGFESSLLDGYNVPGLEQRAKYFTDARLHKIRENLGNLVVEEDSVLDILDKHKCNKVYLTNIVGYNDSDFSEGSLLFAGANKIPVGGLIYISNGTADKKFLSFMQSLGLEKDDERSEAARRLEPNWKPDVYKRIK